MRTLFIAAGKVFGVLQIYTGLAYVASVLPLLRMFNEPSSPTVTTLQTFFGSIFSLSVVSLVSTLILTFGVAWLLIFRTEWLANILKLPEDKAEPPFGAEALLGAGVRLIGIFFVIQSAPQLIGNLVGTISSVHQFISLQDQMGTGVLGHVLFERIWSGLLAEAIKLALALLLVFKTDSILNRIKGIKS